MARQISMPYQFPPVSLLAPAADSAGRTSSYRDLRNALKAWVVAEVNQGAANTVLLSILQGQDVSGTGSKAVGAMPIWLDADTSISDALVVQTAAATYTTSATTKNKIVVFEITPEMCMDVGNGFKTIAISTGSSSASNITRAELIIWQAIQGASAPSTYV